MLPLPLVLLLPSSLGSATPPGAAVTLIISWCYPSPWCCSYPHQVVLSLPLVLLLPSSSGSATPPPGVVLYIPSSLVDATSPPGVVLLYPVLTPSPPHWYYLPFLYNAFMYLVCSYLGHPAVTCRHEGDTAS